MKKNISIFLGIAIISFVLFNKKTFVTIIRNPAAIPAEVQDLFQRFVTEYMYSDDPSTADSYRNFVLDFNNGNSGLTPSEDWIDSFLSSLPKRILRHHTFVHRSYSVQSGTPMSPRVILFTPDARTIMTFNSKWDQNGDLIPGTTGGESIEIIEWNKKKLSWDFAELTHDGKKIVTEENPASCVMCHAGTPKPIVKKHIPFYQGNLKPIFPQYPLWPGFYGSVNDIVGVPGSDDEIMVTDKATKKHIDGFLFDDSEELFRLRKAVDTNPLYMDVIRHEVDIHRTYFRDFSKSMKDRKRYRHLISLKEQYTSKGEEVPEFLKSAPYRRNFEKKYGHYILRPNFYLSTLVTFYHAQAIAREIIAFPEYDRMKFSFLATKFNCQEARSLKANNLSISDLNPSFDLIYPNVATEESRDHQYLLAYQYNLVHSKKTGKAHLPLFAWNLEANEEIASYHYGNVFSDLNEMVLWNLAAHAFDNIDLKDGRNAYEARHADFNTKDHLGKNNREMELFANELNKNIGSVSRFTSSQMQFATTRQTYYGMDNVSKKFKGLPVSKHCRKDFVPAAQRELKIIANSMKTKKLPHLLYPIDEKLTDIKHVPQTKEFLPISSNGTRQACEACHNQGLMKPQINTDWHSDLYYSDIKNKSPWYRFPKGAAVSLKEKIHTVLDPKLTLPVPFGNLMPYGRRPMDAFSLLCEKKLVTYAFEATKDHPKFGEKFKCHRTQLVVNGVPQFKKNGSKKMILSNQTPENIENCRCRSLYIRKHFLAEDYYHIDDL